VQAVRHDAKVGDVVGCTAYGDCDLEPHHPDLFWYGIHGVELLFTIMGPGCESVARVHTKNTDVVTGIWKDGRIGTFRGLRTGKRDDAALVFGSQGVVPVRGSGGYQPLVVEISKFFKTGKTPVSLEDTVEIYAFMEAADDSKRQGGALVSIKSVMDKARASFSK
jgi:hypothetical protein